MMALTAMSSFSDAQELPEIPIIAANLHSLILPRQSKIWAVLHQADSVRRLIYSLAATYREASPVIKHGISRRFGNIEESWRHAEGWQTMVRVHPENNAALVIVHVFAGNHCGVSIPLPAGEGWYVQEARLDDDADCGIFNDHVVYFSKADFSAPVVLLNRVGT